MTLDKLPVGETATIGAVGGQGALRLRLLDMGLIPKTQVKVQKIAPLGDPMEIRVRGYELTLRLEDAARISLLAPGEEVPPPAHEEGRHGHVHHHGETESLPAFENARERAEAGFGHRHHGLTEDGEPLKEGNGPGAEAGQPGAGKGRDKVKMPDGPGHRRRREGPEGVHPGEEAGGEEAESLEAGKTAAASSAAPGPCEAAEAAEKSLHNGDKGVLA